MKVAAVFATFDHAEPSENATFVAISMVPLSEEVSPAAFVSGLLSLAGMNGSTAVRGKFPARIQSFWTRSSFGTGVSGYSSTTRRYSQIEEPDFRGCVLCVDERCCDCLYSVREARRPIRTLVGHL